MAEEVYEILKKIYPNYKIDVELYFNSEGNKLYWDFFIRELKVAVECHGRQHYEFVEHFHGDRMGFIQGQRRDRMKKDYAIENDIAMVEISYKDKLSVDFVRDKVMEAIYERERTHKEKK
jgi:hypothetical protein